MAGHADDIPYRVVAAPPRGMRIRYYLGGHLPEAYRAWVEDDIASPDWPFRKYVARQPWMLLCLVPLFLFVRAETAKWFLLAIPITMGLGAWISYASRDTARYFELARHRRFWKEN